MLTTEMLQVNRIKIKNWGGVQYIKVFSLSNSIVKSSRYLRLFLGILTSR